jgi:hypothetical protein
MTDENNPFRYGRRISSIFLSNNSPEFAKIGLFEGDIGRKGKCTTSVGMEGGELSWSYLLSNG